MKPISFNRHRFPADVIRNSVWLYLRFSLSFRNVEELLAQRGIEGSYQTNRCRTIKFGPLIARRLKKRRRPPSPRRHLDEMVCWIGGKRMYLWRAVDDEGEILDLVVHRRPDTEAALRLLKRLLNNQPVEPAMITTDALCPTGQRSTSWVCVTFIDRAGFGRTFERRTPTSRSGDETDSSSGSNLKLQLKDSSPPTRQSTTPSTSSTI